MITSCLKNFSTVIISTTRFYYQFVTNKTGIRSCNEIENIWEDWLRTRSKESLPQLNPGYRYNTVSKIMVIARTHNAVDVLEGQLQRGTRIFRSDIQRMLCSILPPYHQIWADIRGLQMTTNWGMIEEVRSCLISQEITETYSESITLARFWSLHRAFTPRKMLECGTSWDHMTLL